MKRIVFDEYYLSGTPANRMARVFIARYLGDPKKINVDIQRAAFRLLYELLPSYLDITQQVLEKENDQTT
jgi:hypothetical protein